jgi:hypothetical protein
LIIFDEKHCDAVSFYYAITRGSTQDQEKITGTDISKKRRMEDADKEANDQGIPLVIFVKW